MSTNKHIDRLCCIFLLCAFVLTAVLLNGESFGIVSVERELGYESRLFDKSQVHTVDIVMDNWDDFIADCEGEEYSLCAVVIDGESYKNVAIRAKGNTSLSQVSSLNSERYSFKIEFDHYDSGKSYYGLDKLCLNNIIQDSTYMKDYLCYTLMDEFGADAPLCSYVYITVNGEDWGLYLAVESIEDSFLERNYGGENGDLYKPDSMSFGGGRGNGRGFDMDDFMDKLEDNSTDIDTDTDTGINAKTENGASASADAADSGAESNDKSLSPSDLGGGSMGGNMPDGMQGDSTTEPPEKPDGSDMPDIGNMPDMSNMTDGDTGNESTDDADSTDSTEKAFGNFDFSDFDFSDFDFTNIGTPPDMGGGSGGNGGKGGGFGGGMGSDDVKLIYTDDDFDSYSNIFDNAKTDVTDTDKERLIAALKSLGEYEDLESVVNIDEVIRYFVVHNFVVNGDSYTGSMIHNYYLYEQDGQLSMIPWDYNLAFGGFQGNDASSVVNDDIDAPLSVTGSGDRPMMDWILQSEEYIELYHEYFDEFIGEYFESGYVSELIKSTAALISPYVEKDPTAFYTYDEFEGGWTTLETFCELRAESVRNQLNGDDTEIDASSITISDMGSMNNAMGGGMKQDFAQIPNMGSRQEMPTAENGADTADPNANTDATDITPPDMADMADMTDMPNMEGIEPPNADSDTAQADGNDSSVSDESGTDGQKSKEFSGGDFGQRHQPDENMEQIAPSDSTSGGIANAAAPMLICLAVLICAFVFALLYKRRKH